MTQDAHIYHTRPLGDDCVKQHFGSFFFQTLKHAKATERYGYNYNYHPGRVCYRYGLFNDRLFTGHMIPAINNIKSHYKVAERPCPGNNAVTLLARDHRIWLNINDVKNALVSAGYVNSTIHNMGKLTPLEQFRMVYCTDVLIGAHGAELTWADFMRPNSFAIEIAWPKFNWRFAYSFLKLPIHDRIHFMPENATDVRNHKDTFFKSLDSNLVHFIPLATTDVVNHKKSLADVRRTEPHEPEDRLGKYCNFRIDPKYILEVVKIVRPL